MYGTLLDDGNTCGSSYYYGYSINIDEFAEEMCQTFHIIQAVEHGTQQLEYAQWYEMNLLIIL